MTQQAPAPRSIPLEIQQRLRLLDLSLDLCFIADFQARAIYVNPAWERQMGYRLEHFAGRPFTDFVHPEDHERCTRQLQRVISGDTTLNFEARFQAGDGTYRWLLWNCVPAVDEQLIFGAARDITNRKSMEQALLRDKEQLAIQHRRQSELAEMQLAINTPRELQDTLRQICELTTRFLPSSGGASILLWDPKLEEFSLSASTVPEQDPQTAARRVRRAGGATRWIVDHRRPLVVSDTSKDPFTANPMLSENHFHAYAGVPLVVGDQALGVLYALDRQIRDYSRQDVDFLVDLANRAAVAVARVRLYEALRVSNRLLAASREELQLKNHELARSNAELLEFAHVVSHDLKAPLRGINQLAQWIGEDHAAGLAEEGRRQLQLLQDRARLMNNLIDGILSYSRAGRAEEDIVPVDLDNVVNEVTCMLDLPEPGTCTVTDALPTVPCQHTQIRQVFQNLIGNALKYGDPTRLRISVSCHDEGDVWRFTVSDNGPGIESRYFEKIFKMFQRGAQDGHTEGTGVGLALTKKIVELHHGRIWVESEVRRGSDFHFTLPKTPPSNSQSQVREGNHA